ncbi:NADH dehydrogenase [ubiquinone] 1 alpha subcomplex assembly factor 2 [Rhipicephalus microplus]|uniref:NADH dehydrogenase [ubiquinone] 1 alpha subcomplex assembly factor 2 n=1 Tax=Rhipicephalus microplus TaxID=6941 RepID=UPI002F2B093E
MSSPGRGVIARIWRNFLASITTKQLPQREVGRDHFGNKYFEIAADPSRGKRKPRRWFEPRTKDNFAADMPPEWEAWLRGRRSFPPSQEEIAHNEEIKKLKQQRAALSERNRMEVHQQKGGSQAQLPTGFPMYDDYKEGNEEMNRGSTESSK